MYTVTMGRDILTITIPAVKAVKTMKNPLVGFLLVIN